MRLFFRKMRINKITRKLNDVNKNSHGIKVDSEKIAFIENIVIGSYSRIGPNNMINAQGGLFIGTNVIFGPNCVIWTVNHKFSYAKLLPYDESLIFKPVVIGDNCWFGEGVKIAPGVTIGDGVIAAMGSVILDDIPSFSIISGNPAKVRKLRSDVEHYRKLDNLSDSYLRNKNEKL